MTVEHRRRQRLICRASTANGLSRVTRCGSGTSILGRLAARVARTRLSCCHAQDDRSAGSEDKCPSDHFHFPSILASSLRNEGESGRFRDREHRRASAGGAHPSRSLLIVGWQRGLIPRPWKKLCACKPAEGEGLTTPQGEDWESAFRETGVFQDKLLTSVRTN
jgi:hypothetical protein